MLTNVINLRFRCEAYLIGYATLLYDHHRDDELAMLLADSISGVLEEGDPQIIIRMHNMLKKR